ncbi:hypothetical protein [Xanthomonas graminis]|jgi:hypothetical protein|uniref:hypothetical protein n=1 Tax=Xanthomonas graminis TaxID=3390026 RepID=UPI00029C9046|nr:hypothetical protein [Xanthomonas translucens]EKU23695.1 hypothetical protein XTG29_03540 [Xanthomonas translucens pv. graminis ART-Xtg29]OAX62870.1 hypothetical protein A6R72_00725 [Xanthomonas translucens pv. graminis]UKE54262.1 hypothetical protein KFS84_19470 [Xanthomonas translucens pv. graminis]WIH08867.1 hypothetical protein KM579_00970 [Xanthomonas translucens pv. graminis]WIH12166.1 hypothetical protein KM563_19580 [Xanthomonas translucens pv. graminis]
MINALAGEALGLDQGPSGRVVAGVVAGNGQIRNGSGFSVARTSTGHYLLSFQPAFETLGGAAITQIYSGDGDTRDNAVILRIDARQVLIKTGDGNGAQSDRDFSFVALGQGAKPA